MEPDSAYVYARFSPRQVLRILLVLFVAIAMLAPTTAALRAQEPAHQSELAPGRERDPLVGNARGEAFLDQEVDLVRERYGIDERTARLHMALSARSGDLLEKATSRFPDTFAGGYIDDSRVRLVLRFTRDAEASARELARGFFNPQAVSGDSATHRLADLEAGRERIVADADELRVEHGVFAWNVDVIANDVVLSAENADADTEHALQARYPGVPLRVVQEKVPQAATIPPSSAACEFLFVSCNPLRGSTVWNVNGDPMDLVRCTIGYNATRNSDGARRMITAGHCTNSTMYHSQSSVGSMAQEAYSGNVDAQVHSVASGWSHSRWIIHIGSTTAQAYAITGRYTGTSVANGSTLCVTGGHTQTTTCAAVTNNNYGFTDNNGVALTNFIRFGGCVNSGDSGGPVYAGSTAYGIVTHRLGTCDAAAPYIRNVEQALGVTVRTT